MLLEKGKAKFDWKPKKGSWKRIQEGVLKNGVLKEEGTPEQEALHKKYTFMDAADVDPAWIKKNNMEKVWSRKSIDPRVKKTANEFSKAIKQLGGVAGDEGKMKQLEDMMKKHVSKGKGWMYGDPFDDVIKLQGVSIYQNIPDWIGVVDHAARKDIQVSLKDGKIKVSGGGMGGWGNPAANEKEAEEGLYSGYIQ